MTKNKALDLLLKNNSHFRGAFNRMLLWDSTLTARQLSQKLSTSCQYVHTLARNYGLKYKKDMKMGACRK